MVVELTVGFEWQLGQGEVKMSPVSSFVSWIEWSKTADEPQISMVPAHLPCHSAQDSDQA